MSNFTLEMTKDFSSHVFQAYRFSSHVNLAGRRRGCNTHIYSYNVLLCQSGTTTYVIEKTGPTSTASDMQY